MATILTMTLNPAVDLFGEVDVVRPIHKMRTSNDRADPGGGGINVARVITMLGGDAEAVFLAGGATGAWLDAMLEAEGITRRMLPIAGNTRVSFAVNERGTGHDYRFVPGGPAISAAEMDACLDVVRAYAGRYVVASGSLPDGASPDFYARMAAIAADTGARFVLDCASEGLRATLERGGVYLVKPSQGELEQLVGHTLDEDGVRDAALSLVRQGAAELVAVTMGAYGALLASADGTLRVPAARVSVRSAIGAGDSFLGAMVWALSNDWTLEQAFRFGAAAGTAKVQMPGTQLCRRDDIYALYRMPPMEAQAPA